MGIQVGSTPLVQLSVALDMWTQLQVNVAYPPLVATSQTPYGASNLPSATCQLPHIMEFGIFVGIQLTTSGQYDVLGLSQGKFANSQITLLASTPIFGGCLWSVGNSSSVSSSAVFRSNVEPVKNARAAFLTGTAALSTQPSDSLIAVAEQLIQGQLAAEMGVPAFILRVKVDTTVKPTTVGITVFSFGSGASPAVVPDVVNRIIAQVASSSHLLQPVLNGATYLSPVATCAAGLFLTSGLCCPAGQINKGGLCAIPTCTDGQFFDGSKCASCGPTCTHDGGSCYDNLRCSSCASTLQLVNGICCPPGQFNHNGVCSLCGSTCNSGMGASCLNTISCTKCTTGSGLLPTNGICCPVGQVGRADGTCHVPCNVKNCLLCSSANVCQTCGVGHVLDGAFCAQTCPSVPNCQICASNITCFACMAGYVPVNVGTSCRVACPAVPNCHICASPTTCQACTRGFFVSTMGSCTSCPENCATCSGTNTCSKCNAGFKVSTDSATCLAGGFAGAAIGMSVKLQFQENIVTARMSSFTDRVVKAVATALAIVPMQLRVDGVVAVPGSSFNSIVSLMVLPSINPAPKAPSASMLASRLLLLVIQSQSMHRRNRRLIGALFFSFFFSLLFVFCLKRFYSCPAHLLSTAYFSLPQIQNRIRKFPFVVVSSGFYEFGSSSGSKPRLVLGSIATSVTQPDSATLSQHGSRDAHTMLGWHLPNLHKLSYRQCVIDI